MFVIYSSFICRKKIITSIMEIKDIMRRDISTKPKRDQERNTDTKISIITTKSMVINTRKKINTQRYTNLINLTIILCITVLTQSQNLGRNVIITKSLSLPRKKVIMKMKIRTIKNLVEDIPIQFSYHTTLRNILILIRVTTMKILNVKNFHYTKIISGH